MAEAAAHDAAAAAAAADNQAATSRALARPDKVSSDPRRVL